MHTTSVCGAQNTERCCSVRVASDSDSLQKITGFETTEFSSNVEPPVFIKIDMANIEATSPDELFVYNTREQAISIFGTDKNLIIKILGDSSAMFDGDILFISVFGHVTLAEYQYDAIHPKIQMTPDLRSSFHEGVEVIGVVVGQVDHEYPSILNEEISELPGAASSSS